MPETARRSLIVRLKMPPGWVFGGGKGKEKQVLEAVPKEVEMTLAGPNSVISSSKTVIHDDDEAVSDGEVSDGETSDGGEGEGDDEGGQGSGSEQDSSEGEEDGSGEDSEMDEEKELDELLTVIIPETEQHRVRRIDLFKQRLLVALREENPGMPDEALEGLIAQAGPSDSDDGEGGREEVEQEVERGQEAQGTERFSSKNLGDQDLLTLRQRLMERLMETLREENPGVSDEALENLIVQAGTFDSEDEEIDRRGLSKGKASDTTSRQM